MTSDSPKVLYLAESMKNLESKTELGSPIPNLPTNRLVPTAIKVFQAAENSYLEKDEENAYLHYMWLLELIFLLKKRSDFRKDNFKNYKELLECANIAVSKAEILKESLTKRYTMLQQSTCMENRNKELCKNKPETAVITDKVFPEKSKAMENLSISSTELHSLITSSQPSIIIMDTRSARDFAESHIKHICCINVPQEILKRSLRSARLESMLPEESYSLWFIRSEVDWIILVDWDSKNEITDNIHWNALKIAISKWDQNCVLKKTPVILALLGGYKEWMLKYPTYTTQALNFDLMDDVQTTPIVSDADPDENLCKICMEENIDSLFLECGHMATCLDCGNRLKDCPICRQSIARVVRTFKC